MYGMISRTRLLLSASAAVAAVAAPAASAMHAPGDFVGAAPADPPAAYAAIQYDQLGPKYVTLSHRPSAAQHSTRLSR